MNARRIVFGILAAYLAACVIMGNARAANVPRYDTFRSRLSGNVVKIPARCWAEDSLAHLYLREIEDHGAKVTFGCHHKGY